MDSYLVCMEEKGTGEKMLIRESGRQVCYNPFSLRILKNLGQGLGNGYQHRYLI